MEPDTPTEKPRTLRKILRGRWPVLVTYLFILIVAETFVGIGAAVSVQDPSKGGPYYSVGLTIHILLVFALLFHAVLIGERDRPLALLLPGVSLASLDRILSLAVPRFDFSLLQWLGLVSVPLLTAAGSVAYVLGLRLKDIGFGPITWRKGAVQTSVAATGLGLGAVEYLILGPSKAYLPIFTTTGFLFGVVVLFLATGLSEEIIFRGIMLRCAVDALGTRPGLLFVTAVFATLHLFYQNAADLVFVFGVGLFYGLVVLRTRLLWGVTISHTIANIVLYLVAPFFFPTL